MRITKNTLSGYNNGSASNSVNSPFTGAKKQRIRDIESPVTNIGIHKPGSGIAWIGPITPYSLGGRVPEPGSIATLVPPQRYLQEGKKQAEEKGYVYNYVFNPTPDGGSGIPATYPPSNVPLTSTIWPSSSQISPEAAQKIPYNLIIIGVLGLAGIYLLKKRKK